MGNRKGGGRMGERERNGKKIGKKEGMGREETAGREGKRENRERVR